MTNPASRLLMVGVSHAEVPLPLLERVAVRPAELAGILARVREAGYDEAVVLSTCSRTEIYAATASDGADDLVSVLAGTAGPAAEAVQAVARRREGRDVVEHLFRVTAGFESRVLGEADIHGQVRAAYRQAQTAGMTGMQLRRLFPAALRCGVQVRACTGLGSQGRSLARRAVEVGLETARTPEPPRILVIGSGQMAATAVDYLRSLGLACRVAARDETYAARLVGADAVCSMADLVEGVRETDLLICATSASQYVLRVGQVGTAMAGRHDPLTIVDLSVPRNVDSVVGSLPHVTLIDVAGLHDAAADDPALMAAVELGSELVRTATQRYLEGITAQDVGLLIAAMRSRIEQVCAGSFGADAHAVAGRLLHRPILAARAAAAAGDLTALLLLCSIFDVRPAEVGLPVPVPAPRAEVDLRERRLLPQPDRRRSGQRDQAFGQPRVG